MSTRLGDIVRRAPQLDLGSLQRQIRDLLYRLPTTEAAILLTCLACLRAASPHLRDWALATLLRRTRWIYDQSSIRTRLRLLIVRFLVLSRTGFIPRSSGSAINTFSSSSSETPSSSSSYSSSSSFSAYSSSYSSASYSAAGAPGAPGGGGGGGSLYAVAGHGIGGGVSSGAPTVASVATSVLASLSSAGWAALSLALGVPGTRGPGAGADLLKRPVTFALQPLLPELPVPDLNSTLARHIASVAPVLDADDLERAKAAAADFARPGGAGASVQGALRERARRCRRAGESWLQEWWLEETYLGCRKPLPFASTWYAVDRLDAGRRAEPTAGSRSAGKGRATAAYVERAARVISGLMEFCTMIREERLLPTVVPVPMCMNQYRRLFSTTRVPGETCDEIVQYPPTVSRHIIVIRKGMYYVVPAYHASGELLSPAEFVSQLEFVVKDADEQAKDSYLPVGVLTSAERTRWSQMRKKLMGVSRANHCAVELIESSLFCVSLEHATPTTHADLARTTFYGNGRNRWFDKSFTLVVTENGQCGVHAEHSYVDAMVVAHLFDFAFSVEGGLTVDYTVARPVLAPPKRLDFVVDDADLKAEVVLAGTSLDKTFTSLDLTVLQFRPFGRRLLKQFDFSTDGFIQMAVQLAYFRVTGEHAFTYETAHTRLFHHGRTETVRSCTHESVAFAEAMVDPHVDRAARLPYLRQAVEAHVRKTRDAMVGAGVDRHLLGLRVMAREMGIPTPSLFTCAASKLDFNLVTSQTTAQRMDGGGFAPWTPEGFGVSYVVRENEIQFHITCYRDRFVARTFADILERSLLEMQAVADVDAGLRRTLSISNLNEITGPGWLDNH